MSKLFYSETGRLLHLENEEVCTRRRIRKVLHLPAGARTGGTLYVLAKPHPGSQTPLRVQVNGRGYLIPVKRRGTVAGAGQAHPLDETDLLLPSGAYLAWVEVPLAAGVLKAGRNVVEIWADSDAMDAWMVGLEPRAFVSGRQPDSALSLDGGRTWRAGGAERPGLCGGGGMGVHHALIGEYVVRIRLNDPALHDPRPPGMVWEKIDCPYFDAVRRVIPARVRRIADPWRRVRALVSWVSTQWRYIDHRDQGIEVAEYCPWDALTILAWRRADHGQYLPNPVAFCTHFSATFIAAALALGIPARGICGSYAGQGQASGHFVCEVWIERWQKWCMVDPTCDFMHLRDGIALSLAELVALPVAERRRLLVRGPVCQTWPAAKLKAYIETLGGGLCYGHWAIWPRNDFLSHPELTPSGHGVYYYAETPLLWVELAEGADLGMFPYRVSMEWAATPPPKAWRR